MSPDRSTRFSFSWVSGPGWRRILQADGGSSDYAKPHAFFADTGSAGYVTQVENEVLTRGRLVDETTRNNCSHWLVEAAQVFKVSIHSSDALSDQARRDRGLVKDLRRNIYAQDLAKACTGFRWVILKCTVFMARLARCLFPLMAEDP